MRLINTNLLNYFYKNGIKPLKDAISGKLDMSKIANNLLTTVSGYALDARQGKVVQDEIDGINSNLSELVGQLEGLFIKKNIGKSCTIVANSGNYLTFDLPSVTGYSAIGVIGVSLPITSAISLYYISNGKVYLNCYGMIANVTQNCSVDVLYIKNL